MHLPPAKAISGLLRVVETASIRELEKVLRDDSQRKYLHSRGKLGLQYWSEEERAALRSYCYSYLDVDSQGYVSLESVYNLLLSLGLVDNRETLQRTASKAGLKFSLAFDFEEFLTALVNPLLREVGPKVARRLKALLTGDEGLSMATVVAAERRQILIDGLIDGSERGLRVMKAVELQSIQGEMSKDARDRLTQVKLKHHIR